MCRHTAICGLFKTADECAFNIGCRNLEFINQSNEAGRVLLRLVQPQQLLHLAGGLLPPRAEPLGVEAGIGTTGSAPVLLTEIKTQPPAHTRVYYVGLQQTGDTAQLWGQLSQGASCLESWCSFWNNCLVSGEETQWESVSSVRGLALGITQVACFHMHTESPCITTFSIYAHSFSTHYSLISIILQTRHVSSQKAAKGWACKNYIRASGLTPH